MTFGIGEKGLRNRKRKELNCYEIEENRYMNKKKGKSEKAMKKDS